MLEIQGLRKIFGSLVAVNDVSFTIEPGQIVGLLGPNGAGKTVRWAIDGLDAMTWRGVGLSGAIRPTLVLLGFTAAFGALALRQFRWEEA